MCLLHRTSAHLGAFCFWVANGNYQNLGPGMIGGNAEVNASASNISTGDFFDQILNYGGASIGGHAAINLTATTLSVGGNLDSRIDNFSGGSINGSATLNFNLTADLAAQGEANFQILNNDAGQIGGNGNISVTTGGDLTANSTFAFHQQSQRRIDRFGFQPYFQHRRRSQFYRRCNLCHFESE